MIKKGLVALSIFVSLAMTSYFYKEQLMVTVFDLFFESTLEDSLKQTYYELETDLQRKDIEQPKGDEEPFSVLLLGKDAGKNERGRTDVMIVSIVRPTDKQVLLLSIPRDSYVPIEGRGEDKITHAYAFGKEELAIQTVEYFLDIPIDYYATINFKGFEQTIDALGGIPLPLEKDAYAEQFLQETSIEPGKAKYSGSEALQYARFRDDADGDLGRTKRHQAVINAVLEKSKNVKTIAKLPDLFEIVSDNIQTNMKAEFMIEQAKFFVLGKGSLVVENQTVTGKGDYKNGVFYYFIPEEEIATTQALLKKWLTD